MTPARTLPVSDFDHRMMRIALRMGLRGLGRTAPNPSVGAVIADETTGEIIARGWTQPGGRPHAETEAIARAGARARGATMYVTLEPCSHHGRTPPCADAVVAAGLGRVVAAIEDPDPRVAGRGLERLRSAGIAVARGVLAEPAHWLTRGHIVRVTERRPFVQLKLALGADGAVPRGSAGQPAWVTDAAARSQGHLMRARADAILVGSRTVIDDDPALSCRLPGMLGRSPLRVVLASTLGVPLTARVVATARQIPTLMVCSPAAAATRRVALEHAGCSVAEVQQVGGALWLPAVLEHLAARGVTRLLVEGGPSLWRAFASAGLVDEVVLFVARAAARADWSMAIALAADHIGPMPLEAHDTAAAGPDRRYEFHTLAPRVRRGANKSEP